MTNPNTDKEKAGGVNLFLTQDHIAITIAALELAECKYRNSWRRKATEALNAIKSQIGGRSCTNLNTDNADTVNLVLTKFQSANLIISLNAARRDASQRDLHNLTVIRTDLIKEITSQIGEANHD